MFFQFQSPFLFQGGTQPATQADGFQPRLSGTLASIKEYTLRRHASDSTEQQQAEIFMLRMLADTLGLNFDNNTKLPMNIIVQPDAIDLDKKVIVEAYAHIGELKGAQHNKVKGDILKLILIEEKLGEGWRKILCFADEAAAKYVRSGSWVAEAVRTFGIEVHVVHLPEEQLECVQSAQKRQRMVNPD